MAGLLQLFNSSEDTFPLTPELKSIYGPFGFPEPPDDRPYTTSNFVMGLDGRVSFRDAARQVGGRDVSRSSEDRWMMDFIRAHHHAQIIGANTLREEPGLDGKGWDYAIEDSSLLDYRTRLLGLGKQKVLILTARGDLNLGFNVFNSERVEPWIVTSSLGLERLAGKLRDHPRVRTVVVGNDKADFPTMMGVLRQRYDIERLLCEGGPSFYGDLLQQQLIDEDFRTISAQVLGASSGSTSERPTAYGQVSYVTQTAPWFEIISIHLARPYHLFLRLRYRGPRQFQD